MKIYALEEGSGVMHKILKGTQGPAAWAHIYVSTLALPESVAAVERKYRTGDIDGATATRCIARLRQDLIGANTRYGVVEVARSITVDAAQLAQDHGLRGFDSVQLATALTVRAAIPAMEIYQFLCADGDLVDAAQAVGLQVLVPGS